MNILLITIALIASHAFAAWLGWKAGWVAVLIRLEQIKDKHSSSIERLDAIRKICKQHVH